MKLFLTSLFFILNSALAFSQEAEFSLLEKKTIKFPDIQQGELLEHTYTFTNTGNIPLIIEDYSVTCHCTKVVLPKKPIPPGQKGEIKMTFNSAGKYYLQDRVILLEMNTKKKTEKIRFKVYVIPQEN